MFLRNPVLKVACLFSFFLSAVLVQAQNTTGPDKRLILKMSVPHIFINGINLEAEKGLKNKRYSVLFSPRFYTGATRTIDGYTGREEEGTEPNKMLGYGAEIMHRLYTAKHPEDLTNGLFYFAYGVNFHHFQFDYQKFGWVEELNEKGLYYYQYKFLSNKDKINRWGGLVQLGWQEPFIKQRVLLDFFVGLSYRHSQITSAHFKDRYTVNALDYGFTGLSPVSGLKLGYVLR